MTPPPFLAATEGREPPMLRRTVLAAAAALPALIATRRRDCTFTLTFVFWKDVTPRSHRGAQRVDGFVESLRFGTSARPLR